MSDTEFDDFAPLTAALDDLASRIDPAARRTLARAVATDLRSANAKRIKANVEPDGGAMTPRKKKASGKIRSRRLRDTVTKRKASVRSQPMFQGAVAQQYLRKQSSPGEAQVGFVGAMARIMRVHHYGLRDTVTRDPASTAVTYDARPVIGLTPDDRLRILDQVTAQIQP